MPTAHALGHTHRALFADTVEDVAGHTADLAEVAVRQGRAPVVVVVRPQVERCLRALLGPEVEPAVTVLHPVPDRAPGAVARDHLEAHPRPGSRTAVVTEFTADHDPFGASCLEFEVTAEQDLVGPGSEHTCIYPRTEPFARIARVSHPLLREDGRDRANPEYRGADLLHEEPALAHLDPHATVREVVPHVDPDLRAWLADQATAAHLAPALVDQIVLSIHEALRSGAESRVPDTEPGAAAWSSAAQITADHLPTTRLYLHRPGATAADRGRRPRLTVDVDAARLPRLDPHRLPDDRAVTGLWFARAACRDVDISVHPLTETSSRIRVTAPPPAIPEAPHATDGHLPR